MYKLQKLPYSYEDLEPYIDTHTLGLHYNKHLKNYLNKLNELLTKNNYDFKYNLIELNFHIDDFPKNIKEDILFNLGGVINHIIYFNSMSDKSQNPSESLKQAINKDFGGFLKFKEEFKKSAMSLKGSGYTFLVFDKDKLKIINLSNQDNPYYHKLIPLLAIDLWEHAYYINYENKKDLYIDNFFKIMDFSYANKIFL